MRLAQPGDLLYHLSCWHIDHFDGVDSGCGGEEPIQYGVIGEVVNLVCHSHSFWTFSFTSGFHNIYEIPEVDATSLSANIKS